jgi:rhodanese-related sulfurtransferase
MSSVPSISVQDLHKLYEQGADFLLLDVREAHELAICELADATHIPLQSLPQRYAELPVDKPIVVNCHHGGRSAQATAFLLSQGFDRVLNLSGGIHAWAEEIEPGMARY